MKKEILFKTGLAFLLTSLLVGCSSTRPDTILRNESFSYGLGLPHVSISSSGYYNEENNVIVKVISEVIPSSLITFRNDSISNENKLAEVEITYEIYNTEDKDIEIREKHREIIEFESTSVEQEENQKFIQDFQVSKAGSYEIVVFIKDLKSMKTVSVSDFVIIPDINQEGFGLSNINFTAKSSEDSTFIPVTTYEVTQDFDEIRFENQITNHKPEIPINVKVRLLKYESDLQPAERMRSQEYLISRLQKKGIDYVKSEVIYSQERSLETGDRVLTYRVAIATPEVGNYRYEISVINNESGNILTRAFDFGVKRAGFPFIKTPRDMARTLYYLMDEKGYEELLAIQDDDSLKKAVDYFWLRNIKNSNNASDILRLYYRRVEDTNKYFSSFKEGWKTDLGMIYILFGPPIYSRDTFNYIRWAYSNDGYSPRDNFYFTRERRQSRVFPFNVYLLDRSQPLLRETEYLILSKWLNGNF